MDEALPPPAPPAPAGPTPARAPGWTVGTAVALTWSVLRRAWWPLLLGALLVQLPLTLMTAVSSGESRLVGYLGGLVGALQAGLVAAGVAPALRGERPRLGAMFSVLGPRFTTVLLQSILAGLGVLIGLVLLVVPGLVLMAGFAVSTPAAVAEPALKANEALQRSWDLTRGRRLPVALAALICALPMLAVATGLIGALELLEAGETVAGQLVTDLGTLPFQVGFAACPAVLYHLLREEREGADPARLGAVFE